MQNWAKTLFHYSAEGVSNLKQWMVLLYVLVWDLFVCVLSAFVFSLCDFFLPF